MIRPPWEIVAVDLYPTYGFTQADLQYLYLVEETRIFEDQRDGVIYMIMDSGPIHPESGHNRYWLKILDDYL